MPDRPRHNSVPENFLNVCRGDSVCASNGSRPFWCQSETSRIIGTIDGLGNTQQRRTYERMETTDHTMILKMLERRAKQFRPVIWLVQEQKRLEAWIDETGMLMLGETHEADRELTAWVGEQREIQGTQDEVLEIHGTQPGKKPDGVIRLVYANANGIDGRFKNNWKVGKLKGIHNDLEVDIAAYNEH